MTATTNTNMRQLCNKVTGSHSLFLAHQSTGHHCWRSRRRFFELKSGISDLAGTSLAMAVLLAFFMGATGTGQGIYPLALLAHPSC